MSDVLELLDGRTKSQPGTSYKLVGRQYGLDTPFISEGEVDESAMAFDLLYADGNQRDGVGDGIEVEGIDLARHVLNPINLFDHGKQVAIPIGLSRKDYKDPSSYTGRKDLEKRQAWDKVYVWQGTGEFPAYMKSGEGGISPYDHAKFCQQFFRMWADGLVRGGSIGYQVKEAYKIPADPVKGIPEGAYLKRVLKLESSAVVLPANMDTVVKTLECGRLGGEQLCPYLAKSLSAQVPVRTKTVVGFADLVQTKGLTSYEVEWIADGKFYQGLVGDAPACRSLQEAKQLCDQKNRCGMKARVVNKLTGEVVYGCKDLPIPHGDLTRTDVPPARWKPGLGAVKAKYRKKANTPGTKGYYVRRAGENQWEVADASTGKVIEGPFSSEQEAYDTLKRLQGKFVPRRWGNKAKQERDKLNSGGKNVSAKSLKDVRAKYQKSAQARARKAKAVQVKEYEVGCRHGKKTAKFLVTAKDLEQAVSLAKSQSKAKANMPASAVKRVKLIGTKSLPAQEKTVTKPKTKDMPQDMSQISATGGDPALDAGLEEAGLAGQGEEPYGAQVMRHIHKTAGSFLKDLDDGMGALEHEHVKGHTTSVCEGLTKFIDDTEKLWGKHYKELEPLEGMESVGEEVVEGEDKDADSLDDNAVGDDSAEVELPTEEEVVTGMDTETPREGDKRLNGKVKADDPADAGTNCPGCGKPRGPGGTCECGKSMGSDLQDHEMQTVGGASGYLKELSDPASDFDDESRMKAYHWHASLKAIGEVQDAGSIGGDPGAVPGQEEPVPPKHLKKSEPGSEEWQAEEVQEPAHASKGHRKMCKDASDFLGNLSREKAFGDPHREQALHHHKQLDQIAGGGGEVPNPEQGVPGLQQEGGGTGTDIGDMGEGSLDDEDKKQLALIQRVAQKNADDFSRLQEQFASMFSVN